MAIQWTHAPDPKLTTPNWQLIVPRTRTFVGGLCINSTVIGTYLHWVSDQQGRFRDYPCLGDGLCPICPRRRRWKGYLPVLYGRISHISILQVTETVIPGFHAHGIDPFDLRGRWIFAHRPNGHAQGEYAVDYKRAAEKPEGVPLPPELNIMPWLHKLWGYQPEDESEMNPLNLQDPLPPGQEMIPTEGGES